MFVLIVVVHIGNILASMRTMTKTPHRRPRIIASMSAPLGKRILGTVIPNLGFVCKVTRRHH